MRHPQAEAAESASGASALGAGKKQWPRVVPSPSGQPAGVRIRTILQWKLHGTGILTDRVGGGASTTRQWGGQYSMYGVLVSSGWCSVRLTFVW